MLYDKISVSAIKIAVGNLERLGISSKDVLVGSVACLHEYYEQTKDYRYLEKAAWTIYAYLELGYSYEMSGMEFQKVLNELQPEDKKELLKSKNYRKKLALKKTNIRYVLGRWNARLHSIKIDEAVNDIYLKAVHVKEGEYLYHSGKMTAENGRENLYEKTFKLFIRNDEIILQDVCQNKYYEFQRSRKDDTYSNS